MATQSERARVPVRCENCDTILVAEIAGDGSVRPLGTSEDCVCGDGTFTRLEQPAVSVH
ncbi:hypothetical protein [Natrinema salinisoli]|uniref:hypothetical protein n=1 Tax=Natrinema salinisoli TaxID=2878535 RepID=UPI001CF05ECC|nr:hypothetical protein [Natrinema salinisoli]